MWCSTCSLKPALFCYICEGSELDQICQNGWKRGSGSFALLRGTSVGCLVAVGCWLLEWTCINIIFACRIGENWQEIVDN